MRKIREVLRLRWGKGLSGRAAARAVKASPSTVSDYLARARVAGLSWPLPDGVDDEALEELLFPTPVSSREPRPDPDFKTIHKELKRYKHVTLQLLWEEYKQAHPDGYQYSRFCDLYRAWRRVLDVCMRQEHRAGERVFVDFAGQLVDIADPRTGEVTGMPLFLGVLGASNYTYAGVCRGQDLASWLGAHVRMFEYFEGVPEIGVPDNLKAGVKSPCRYDPEVNPAYAELAEHYNFAVVPARVRKPKDKAKVETGVLIAERWILARLRKRVFFSLEEAQRAVAAELEELNRRPFKKLPGNRRQLFEELDAPALQPLPATPYVLAQWCRPRVNIDYHVEVAEHCYSVPYQLVGERLDARFTDTVVEVFRRGRRIASYRRSYQRFKHTTDPAHMPSSHRAHAKWTPSRIEAWAATAGPSTAGLTREIMKRRPHPEQGFRACLGIIRLGDKYGTDRLERACCRALAVRSYSYGSVKSILDKGLDRSPDEDSPTALPLLDHPNIRGAAYYGDTSRPPAPSTPSDSSTA